MCESLVLEKNNIKTDALILTLGCVKQDKLNTTSGFIL